MYLFFTIDKLTKFVSKLKTIFAPIKHTHDAAEVSIDGATAVGDTSVTNAGQAVTKLKELFLELEDSLASQVSSVKALVSAKQDKENNTDLTTASKSIVGAINEVNEWISSEALKLPEYTTDMRNMLTEAGIVCAPSGGDIGEEYDDGKEYVTLDTMLGILLYCYSLTQRIEDGNNIVDNLEEITDAQIEDLFETASAGEDVAV